MKVKYYSGSKQLNFKNAGYSEIVKDIKNQIYNKEKVAERLDYWYYKEL